MNTRKGATAPKLDSRILEAQQDMKRKQTALESNMDRFRASQKLTNARHALFVAESNKAAHPAKRKAAVQQFMDVHAATPNAPAISPLENAAIRQCLGLPAKASADDVLRVLHGTAASRVTTPKQVAKPAPATAPVKTAPRAVTPKQTAAKSSPKPATRSRRASAEEMEETYRATDERKRFLAAFCKRPENKGLDAATLARKARKAVSDKWLLENKADIFWPKHSIREFMQ